MNHGQWMLVYLRRGTKPKKGITKSLNFIYTVTQLIVPPSYLSPKSMIYKFFPTQKLHIKMKLQKSCT